MPVPPVQPEYLTLGAARQGLQPFPKGLTDAHTEYGREARRASVVRAAHDDDELLRREADNFHDYYNMFGNLKPVEGWLLKQVSLGVGVAWRQYYFRLSDNHGGSLEFDRNPLIFHGRLQWPPITCIRMDRLEDVSESPVRPHAFRVQLLDPEEELILQAPCERAMLQWMRSLRASTARLRRQMTAVVLRLRWCEERDQAELNMDGQALRRVPPQCFELVRLKLGDFSDNHVRSLPSELGQLTALKRLDFSRNRVARMPAELGRLTALNQLRLGRNRLTELPESIGGLTALRILDLSSNALTALPRGIGGLTALRELNCLDNKLRSMPPTLAALTSCTRLNLRGNQLRELPEGIGGLTTLTDLNLWGNRLRELPLTIGGLTNLSQLCMRENGLREVHVVVGGLTSLRSLDLNFNKLANMPESTGALTQLTSLDLGYNRLTWLPEALGGLTALRSLDLRANAIAELPPWIAGLSSLRRLDLGYNRLFSYWGREVRLTDVWRRKKVALLPPMRDPWRRGAVWYEQIKLSATEGIEAPEQPGGGGSDDDDDDDDDGYGSDGTPPVCSHYPMYEVWQRRVNESKARNRTRARRIKKQLRRTFKPKKKPKRKRRPGDPPPPTKKERARLLCARLGGGLKACVTPSAVKARAAAVARGAVGLVRGVGSYIATSTAPDDPVWRQVPVPHFGIPVAISRFSFLSFLDLRENAIRALPRYVGELISLRTLDLSFNHLVRLPDAIGNLHCLVRLSLRSNALVELPSALGGNVGEQAGGALVAVSAEYDAYASKPYSDYSGSDYGGDDGGDDGDDDDEDADSDDVGGGGPRKPRNMNTAWTEGTWEPYEGVPDPREYEGLGALTCLDLFDNNLRELPSTLARLSSLSKVRASEREREREREREERSADLEHARTAPLRIALTPPSLTHIAPPASSTCRTTACASCPRSWGG